MNHAQKQCDICMIETGNACRGELMKAAKALLVLILSCAWMLPACSEKSGSSGGGAGFYNVGGTISGLSGTLLLQNNAGDHLIVTANGPFTFAYALADESPYAVTVLSSPVLQHCAVTNGTGTLDGADVTDVTVGCLDRSWVHPADLSDSISPDGSGTGQPEVAMDDNGSAIVVWDQNDGGNPQIFMSEYRGGAWTDPSDLSDNISPDGQWAYFSEVAMDDNGNAIVVWRQSDGSRWQVFMSEYRSGAWSHPADVADNISPDGQNAGWPQVAMDDNGNAIVAWEQNNGSLNQLFMSEYRGGAWTHPADLSDDISPDGQWAGAQQVAMDDHGIAIIVWNQSDGSSNQVFMSEYWGGAWTHPADLSDNISPDGQSTSEPQVAMDNHGNAIIVWNQSDGSSSQVFMSEYRGDAWTHPADLSDNISPDGQSTSEPQVAMDDNGNAIIVWHQSDGSSDQIFMSEYRGGLWTHPVDLSDNISPNGQSAEQPRAAMDDNGNAIVAWRQHDGINWQIFMSERR